MLLLSVLMLRWINSCTFCGTTISSLSTSLNVAPKPNLNPPADELPSFLTGSTDLAKLNRLSFLQKRPGLCSPSSYKTPALPLCPIWLWLNCSTLDMGSTSGGCCFSLLGVSFDWADLLKPIVWLADFWNDGGWEVAILPIASWFAGLFYIGIFSCSISLSSTMSLSYPGSDSM